MRRNEVTCICVAHTCNAAIGWFADRRTSSWAASSAARTRRTTSSSSTRHTPNPASSSTSPDTPTSRSTSRAARLQVRDSSSKSGAATSSQTDACVVNMQQIKCAIQVRVCVTSQLNNVIVQVRRKHCWCDVTTTCRCCIVRACTRCSFLPMS